MKIIKLNHKDSTITFLITGIAGRGTKCIVYHAILPEQSRRYIIKELYPQNLENEGLICRSKHGNIVVSSSEAKYWESAKSCFNNGIRHYLDYIKRNPQNINEVAPYSKVIRSNDTLYSIAIDTGGIEFGKQPNLSFMSLIDDLIGICKCVGHFHRDEKCILVMDIKKSNFIKTKVGIQLVDFDGLITISEVIKGNRLIYTSETAAPEVIKGDRSRIGPASDVFAVMSMFYEIFTHNKPSSCAWIKKSILLATLKKYALDKKDKLLLAEIILSSLHNNSEKRPKDCLFLAEKIENIRSILNLR